MEDQSQKIEESFEKLIAVAYSIQTINDKYEHKIELVKQLQDYDEKMDCLSEQIQSQQGLVSGMIQKDLQQIRAIQDLYDGVVEIIEKYEAGKQEEKESSNNNFQDPDQKHILRLVPPSVLDQIQAMCDQINATLD